MQSFQNEKRFVLNYYDAIDSGSEYEIEQICASYMSDNCIWQSYHPFQDQRGGLDVARHFWVPLKTSFKRLQRRQDIFFAGRNLLDNEDSVWVVSMGHLMGLFDKDWLSIKATQKMIFLPYAEFNRIEDNKIIRTAFYFDLPHVMTQTGLNPFPHSLGVNILRPGPLTHDGLYYKDQDIISGNKTSQAIDLMIESLGNWDSPLSLEDELALGWHDNMIWWGPTGIGASYTIDRYVKQHAGPFRCAFSNRKFNGHVCRLSEGNYGGFFGRPNLSLKLINSFMGIPPTNLSADMNVIDIYRRDGEKLAENWVFIDLLGFWLQHGVDILSDSLKSSD